MRIKRNSGLHAMLPYKMNRSVKMSASLIVDAHIFNTQLTESRYISVGIYNHQMHIQRLFGPFGNSLHYRESIRDVGNKHAIHNIKMKPVRLTCIYHFYGIIEIPEICGKHRRSKNYTHFYY